MDSFEVVGTIRDGAVYVHHRLLPYREHGIVFFRDTSLGLYRVEGRAVQWPSQQEVVVYRGMDGDDLGKLFVCSPWDFALKFRPVPQEEITEPIREPDPAPPEKVAGYVTQGRH